MKTIDRFDGEYRWLSNFWLADVKFDGTVYPSVEHAYQAAKTTDSDLRRVIRQAATPGKAKRLGGCVFLRRDWERVKIPIMTLLVGRKFQDPDLRNKLKATGSIPIIEGNTWGDVFWGTCNGHGENHLGRILMDLRDKL